MQKVKAQPSSLPLTIRVDWKWHKVYRVHRKSKSSFKIGVVAYVMLGYL